MSSGGGNFKADATAEDLRRVPLLSEYMCCMCKRKKGPQGFANSQLGRYKYQKAQGNSRINGITAKLRCRSCAGEQVRELKCEGQCGLWKSLDEFSKTQRSRGAMWCMECVLWKESLEPGIVAAPPPNSALAPDEDSTIRRDDQGGWMSDPEEGYSDDDDYDVSKEYVSMPYHAMNSLSIAGDDSKSATTVNASGPTYQAGYRAFSTAASTTSDYVAPHLRGFQSAKNSTTTQSEYLPPHLRGFDMRSVSSISNPYEDKQSGQTSTQPGMNGVTYNAYDASGQLHIKQRTPSSQTTTTQGTSASSFRVASNPTQQPRKNTWAKPVGTRTPASQYVVRSGVQKATRYDSDESDDEV